VEVKKRDGTRNSVLRLQTSGGDDVVYLGYSVQFLDLDKVCRLIMKKGNLRGRGRVSPGPGAGGGGSGKKQRCDISIQRQTVYYLECKQKSGHLQQWVVEEIPVKLALRRHQGVLLLEGDFRNIAESTPQLSGNRLKEGPASTGPSFNQLDARTATCPAPDPSRPPRDKGESA
jgi:hypothetical protein